MNYGGAPLDIMCNFKHIYLNIALLLTMLLQQVFFSSFSTVFSPSFATKWGEKHHACISRGCDHTSVYLYLLLQQNT